MSDGSNQQEKHVAESGKKSTAEHEKPETGSGHAGGVPSASPKSAATKGGTAKTSAAKERVTAVHTRKSTPQTTKAASVKSAESTVSAVSGVAEHQIQGTDAVKTPCPPASPDKGGASGCSTSATARKKAAPASGVVKKTHTARRQPVTTSAAAKTTDGAHSTLDGRPETAPPALSEARTDTTPRSGSESDVLAEAMQHGEQVARLAGALFDQLRDLHGLDASWRRRLVEAARLHDIGFVTGRKGHHKASMRRIREDGTLDLSPEDRPLVALLARYHRKAWPSSKHGQYAVLPRRTRKALRRAAALLRIADGLDYTHQALVGRLEAVMEPHRVVLKLYSKAVCSEEMARAVRKGDLFAHVFGLQVECACQPA